MSLSKLLACSSLVLVLASCALDHAFLAPSVLPRTAKSITVKFQDLTTHDTVRIRFAPQYNYTPVFFRSRTDTLKQDFTVESVLFKSTNGNVLNGWMMKPKNQAPRATILHFHGNAGALVSQYQFMTPLLKQGFQVFVFDYSGFGFSEGKATRKNVLTDALAAINYVKTRNDTQNLPLVLYGQSLGGHLAAVAAATKQDALNALVLEAPFSSHKDIAAHRAHQILFVGVVGRVLVKEQYSAKQCIKQFHKPLLVIHSSEDREIPFSMGQEIYNLATAPKIFYAIKKEHAFGPIYYADSISQKIYYLLNQLPISKVTK